MSDTIKGEAQRNRPPSMSGSTAIYSFASECHKKICIELDGNRLQTLIHVLRHLQRMAKTGQDGEIRITVKKGKTLQVEAPVKDFITDDFSALDDPA